MTTFSATDIDTWTSGWKLFILSGWFVLGMVEICFKIYIHKKHYPQIIEALSNSSLIRDAAYLVENKGPIAKSYFLNFIYASINSPVLIKRGWLSETDIKNFPVTVRRLLCMVTLMAYAILAWFVVASVLASVRGHSSV